MKNQARDFFKCYLDFKPQGKHFSPVPFFLCSRERIKAKINRNREGPRQIHRWRSSKLNESGIFVSSLGQLRFCSHLSKTRSPDFSCWSSSCLNIPSHPFSSARVWQSGVMDPLRSCRVPGFSNSSRIVLDCSSTLRSKVSPDCWWICKFLK